MKDMSATLAQGLSDLQTGKLFAAQERFQQVLDEAGDSPQALNGLGNTLRRLGKYSQALACHKRAAVLAPHIDKVQSDFGLAALACGDVAQAIQAFGAAVALSPEHAELHYNLGAALLHDHRFEEARSALSAAVARDPRHARALHNLALANKQLGDPHAALELQERALALAPTDADLEWNLSLTELLLGHYESGFNHFEARTRLPGYPFKGPFWAGSVSKQPLTVLAEQGLGDTLMYARFLRQVCALCPDVQLVCQPALVPLLRDGLLYDVKVTEHAAEDTGPRVPLMSLPSTLGVAHISPAEPYLRADPTRICDFRRRLQSKTPVVGVAYQGNPNYRFDRERSLPVSLLMPLLQLSGFCFISLQKGPGVEQLAHLPRGARFRDLGTSLDNESGAFVETAAVLCAIDLLITTDSAIAHLAGALGVSTWLLLPAIPDFRWGLSGNRWYRSVTILRQARQGAWAEVVDEVAGRLQERVGMETSL